MKGVLTAAVAMLVVLAGSCSSNTPEIRLIEAALVFERPVPLEASFSTHIRLFVKIFDADGIADIAFVRVRHAQNELEWMIAAPAWTIVEGNGEFWVGHSRLNLPNGQLPRGRFEVLVEDLSGRAAEGHFTVPVRPVVPEINRFARFVLDAAGRPYEVQAPESRVLLSRIAATEAGAVRWLTPGRIDLSMRETLRTEGPWYLETLHDGISYVSGPWTVAP